MAPATPLDLTNIQGDILGGLPKKAQIDVFFQILDVPAFRTQLSTLVPQITTVERMLKHRDDIQKHKDSGNPGLLKISGVNIAFSHFGFVELGIDDAKLAASIIEDPFIKGQLKDAKSLHDPGARTLLTYDPDWLPEFKQQIHGVVILTGDSQATVDENKELVLDIFGVPGETPSIQIVTSIRGDVRPGKEAGHEHFGYLDGISNPAVIGFDQNPSPGPAPIRPGVILVGHDGDDVVFRDPWMKDGSFLVFRYMFQRVPEFNQFLKENPIKMGGLSDEEGSELLGARLVGRWKSGAPVDLRPFDDDPALAANSAKNNNFDFAAELSSQKICPFAAHVRKSNPRADLDNNVEKFRILRRGIPFGPEVTSEEQQQNKTIEDRGLIFHCYQSNISNGFRFIQTVWSNDPFFPVIKSAPQLPGLDPITGQPLFGKTRSLTGTNPSDPGASLTLPEWVIPRGGEYFFSPSIKALEETISA